VQRLTARLLLMAIVGASTLVALTGPVFAIGKWR